MGRLFQLLYDEADPHRWWDPLTVREKHIPKTMCIFLFLHISKKI